MIDPKELSAYMSGLGKAGGTKLKAQKLEENPNYFSDLAKKGWKARRKREAEDKSKLANDNGS